MSRDQRWGYLSGLIDMLAYQTAKQGDSKKANCITDTFYRDGQDKALPQMLAVFDKYPDQRPEVLLSAMGNQHCGE